MNRASPAVRAAGMAVLAMALTDGCGTTSAGTPVPTGTAASTGASAGPSGQARPRDLTLDGKDPCALVPRSDWAMLHIEKPGKPQQNETYKSPECVYINNVGVGGVTLVVTEGIEVWHTGKRSALPSDVAPVEGFPAISLRRPEDRNGCSVAVDVADDQYLLTLVVIHPSELPEMPDRCEYARQLAESAMSTLVA